MTYSDYRRIARENLLGNYWPSVLVGFIAALCGALMVGPSLLRINIDAEVLAQLPSGLVAYISILDSIGGTLGFVGFIIGGTVQLGYAKYLLAQHDHSHFDIKDLFSQFDRFSIGFLQSFLCTLYTALWSFLFIIPGIVKRYSYAMTPFILAENPGMTAKEAITASRKLMDGHKFELFILELTFIGWEFLAALTLNLGGVFLVPYKHAARAAFYRELVHPKVTVENTVDTMP